MNKVYSFLFFLLFIANFSDTYSQNTQTKSQPSSNLQGKKIYSLFDSLGANWQQILADLSGMEFDRVLNATLSYGGSRTASDAPNCGMNRAKAMVSKVDAESEDYLFVENVNDVNYLGNTGTIEDDPWFLGSTETVPIYGLTSENEAKQYWNDNFESIVNTNTPELGKCLMLNYEKNGNATRIEIISGPVSDGTIYVTIGTKKYGIEVKAGMSVERIIELLLEYNYGPGWSMKKTSDNSVVLGFQSVIDTEVGLQVNNTGLEFVMTPTSSVASYDRFFIGKSLSDWNDISSWSSLPSLYSLWKGFIEYLTAHFPKMHLYMIIPTYYNYNFSNIPTDADGNILYSDINNNARLRAFRLFEVQKNVANLYGIPIIDLEVHSGINIYNASSFYNNNNVHPKNEGYNQWAKTIYRLFTVEEHDATQTIELKELPSLIYGNADYTLPATTNQGMTITWISDNPNVATVEGNILSIKRTGTTNIIACQEGGTAFSPIIQVYPLSVDNPQFIMGDVNGDNSLTLADAIMILYRSFGISQIGFIEQAADMNGDGNITLSDAIEVLYKSFGVEHASTDKGTTIIIPD